MSWNGTPHQLGQECCRWFFPVDPGAPCIWRPFRLAYRIGIQPLLAPIVPAGRETCRMVTKKFTAGENPILTSSPRRLGAAIPRPASRPGATCRAQPIKSPAEAGLFDRVISALSAPAAAAVKPCPHDLSPLQVGSIHREGSGNLNSSAKRLPVVLPSRSGASLMVWHRV